MNSLPSLLRLTRTRAVPPSFRSSPTVVDGFVYFGTSSGQLLAFRDDCPSESCAPIWSVELTEAIFNLNGVGQYLYESIENLDLPPIMAITLFGAFFVVLFNTLVDIAYAYLDPRVKLGSSASG